MVAQNQDLWLAIIVKLTQRLTERVKDLTLDFRQMLLLSNKVLETSYSKDTMACLAVAIVLKCTNLTQLSVKIRTDQTRGQYYKDC